jgi:hypothetical protein
MFDPELNEKRPDPAEKVRGGEIILRKRWQRVVFVAGLALVAVVGLIVRVLTMR